MKSHSFAFVHPELVVGGAEKLLITTCFSLLKRGHKVTLYTTYYNPNNSFPLPSNENFEIYVYGQWIPRGFFHLFFVLFQYLKMIWLCLCIFFQGKRFDVIINDQVPGINPLLMFLFTKQLFFYGHFPNQLNPITPPRTQLGKLYRDFFNHLETKTTTMTKQTFVNSQFTKDAFKSTGVSEDKLEILYPPIDYDEVLVKTESVSKMKFSDFPELNEFDLTGPFFISINRYQKHKHIELGLEAFAHLKSQHPGRSLKFVIAGGLLENDPYQVDYYNSLIALSESLKLDKSEVLFLKSISEDLRIFLMYHALSLLYTPSEEHFGIVPCEAMAYGCPVIAVASGGPKESILDSITGYLSEADPIKFSSKMNLIFQSSFNNTNDYKNMQMAGKNHVETNFHIDTYINQLLSHIETTDEDSKKK